MMSDGEKKTAPKPHARGSEQRQKTLRVTTRLTWQEHAQFAAKAAAAGLTIPSYIREVGISDRQTKQRVRRTPEAEATMRLVADMNRVGNNLNQLAKQANSGGRPVLDGTLAQLHDVLTAVLAAFGGDK